MKTTRIFNKTIFFLLLAFVSCDEDYSDLPNPEMKLDFTVNKLKMGTPLLVDIDFKALSGITNYCYGFYQSGECLLCKSNSFNDAKPEIVTSELISLASDTVKIECHFNVEARGNKSLYKIYYVYPDGHIEEKR